MNEISREQFEALVRRALDDLPGEFRDRIANLEVAVEDAAGPEDRARTGTSGALLGIYRGVPLSRRGAHYNMAVPDRIVIFQRPIERLARDADELYERVRHVVRHEIAHYFGISDERLREIDAY
ncbi:MAG: metallopeptidase family protein [Dehalococcoidia bacterium]